MTHDMGPLHRKRDRNVNNSPKLKTVSTSPESDNSHMHGKHTDEKVSPEHLCPSQTDSLNFKAIG